MTNLKQNNWVTEDNSSLKKVWFAKKINMLLISIPFMITSLTSQWFAQSQEKSTKTTPVNVESSENTKNPLDKKAESSKKLFDEFIKTIWDKNTIDLTKSELKSFYNTYMWLKSSIWPEFEKYIRKVIFDCYMSLLSKWYHIKDTPDLDELTKFLSTLTDKKITYSSNLWESWNYDQISNTIIIATIKWDTIEIAKKSWFGNILFYDHDVKTDIKINLKELLSAFNTDNPVSFETLIQEKNKINSQKNDTEQKLRETIIALDVSVHKNITQDWIIKDLGDEIKQITKKANNDLETAKKHWEQSVTDTKSSKDKEWGDKIAEQKKQLEAEISYKKQDIRNLELAVWSTKQVGSENESWLATENTRLATENIWLKQKLSDTELSLTQEKAKNNTPNSPSDIEKKLRVENDQLKENLWKANEKTKQLEQKVEEEKKQKNKELEEQRQRFIWI